MNCMNRSTIVQYTTPTITFTFPTIDPATIAEAYLVIKYAGVNVLVKDLDQAEVNEHDITWILSQEDTEKLIVNSTVRIYCDWVTENGLRGRSKRADYVIDETGLSEVLGNA